ncbi:proline-rich antigen 3 [Pochonia chlamydosporia 170]|uniref:Proline-rich antigen 3 n=1 Tax=Pochonia chlamydosporia 170 TaxID=1380566 RepID=A0A179F2M2_METCM|nr:proline-rich antigen 3 [Pochonia chlamydosporia 170]OAQ59685.1 proline-rich antigen 3 [Pochonia chlamydosporia 170]
MQLITILALAGVSSASASLQARSYETFDNLFGRQTQLCKPVTAPFTCERSCGAGYTECIRFPTCYNPGRGDSCCSNGKYCPKGFYCTDGGCCKDGQTLEECGATVSLSVIPPPSTKTSEPAPPSSTAEPTTSEAQTTSYSVSLPIATVSTTSASNGTATATSPPIVTAGAGKNAVAALGALGAFVLAI